MPDVFDAVHAQSRQVREQRGQQASALPGNVPGKAGGALAAPAGGMAD